MNAITSPNVYVRTAVMASCAVPGVYPPVMLMAKNVYGEAQPQLPERRWVDGAVTDDLPAKRLARLYGVNHYIVSQANPLALAIIKGEQYMPVSEGAKKVLRLSTHEILKSGEKFSRRFLRKIPDVGKTMSMFYSVMAQDYKGDVNIVPHFNFVDPQKLLGQLTSAEIDELVIEGERSTWPQLEQIKINEAKAEVVANEAKINVSKKDLKLKNKPEVNVDQADEFLSNLKNSKVPPKILSNPSLAIDTSIFIIFLTLLKFIEYSSTTKEYNPLMSSLEYEI
jgi:predicted acylesterase/phospholipase RssA